MRSTVARVVAALLKGNIHSFGRSELWVRTYLFTSSRTVTTASFMPACAHSLEPCRCTPLALVRLRTMSSKKPRNMNWIENAKGLFDDKKPKHFTDYK